MQIRKSCKIRKLCRLDRVDKIPPPQSKKVLLWPLNYSLITIHLASPLDSFSELYPVSVTLRPTSGSLRVTLSGPASGTFRVTLCGRRSAAHRAFGWDVRLKNTKYALRGARPRPGYRPIWGVPLLIAIRIDQDRSGSIRIDQDRSGSIRIDQNFLEY
jgi:hypothetical protein